GAIPEYWILDPVSKTFEAYQLKDNGYCRIFSGKEGYYSTSFLPEIKIAIANLWGQFQNSPPCLLLEGKPTEPIERPDHVKDIYWGSIPFVPRITLKPTKIKLEEFIAWAPESKFEL